MHSVCFMMLYHKRKPVTRMSMYHLRKVVDFFESQGVETEALVFGDEPDQKEFAEALGLTHIDVPNWDPVVNSIAPKFNKAFSTAVNSGKEYICWLGSNNVHDMEYFRKCIDAMDEDHVYFGSKYFHIASVNHEKTASFTARRFHLCSSGQFYKADKLRARVSFGNHMSSNFDGAINRTLTEYYGRKCWAAINGGANEGMNCIDLKAGGDIHGFDRYKTPHPRLTRKDVEDYFEEVRMFMNGDFNEENYRTAVLATYLSEKERT